VALPTHGCASVRAFFDCYLTFLDHRTNISRKVCAPRRVKKVSKLSFGQNKHGQNITTSRGGYVTYTGGGVKKPAIATSLAAGRKTKGPGEARLNAVALGKLVHITDQLTGRRYLMDTDASFSLVPHQSKGPALLAPAGSPSRAGRRPPSSCASWTAPSCGQR